MRAPSLNVSMTPAQEHAQAETVRVLAFYAADAERERLCACGIALRACQCPLRRDSAGVRLGSTLAT